jgi:hypothetical protein
MEKKGRVEGELREAQDVHLMLVASGENPFDLDTSVRKRGVGQLGETIRAPFHSATGHVTVDDVVELGTWRGEADPEVGETLLQLLREGGGEPTKPRLDGTVVEKNYVPPESEHLLRMVPQVSGSPDEALPGRDPIRDR